MNDIDILHKIDKFLKTNDGRVDTEIEDDYQITWKNNFGADCEVFIRNCAVNGENIAFFQFTDDYNNSMIRIFNNEYSVNWRLKGNQFPHVECHYIKWYDETLIVIYKEKFHYYIYSINGLTLKHFNADLTKVFLKNNELYFSDIHNPEIRKISLPDLELTEVKDDEIEGLELHNPALYFMKLPYEN